MWKRELNSLTVLLHSNIVQIKYVIYDGADRKHHEDSVGYVMECIHCPWLDCSKQNSLQLKHLLALVTRCSRPRVHSHQQRRSHGHQARKHPSRPDQSKLCDFGCAYFIQSSLSSTFATRGTQFYMAPEIVLDDVKACKPFPVDVFAFGVTMWRLLNPGATLQQMSECDWGVLPRVPLALSQLGRRCTSRAPDERPTMQEVYNGLQRIVAAFVVLESFLERAGVVPAEDCAAFACALSAQGVYDADLLQNALQENRELLSSSSSSSSSMMACSAILYTGLPDTLQHKHLICITRHQLTHRRVVGCGGGGRDGGLIES